MTPDEPTPLTSVPAEPPADEAEFRRIGPLVAAKLTGESVQANLSAIGTVSAGSLSATGSAIGVAAIDGDATITASAVPALMGRGDMTVQQSYTSAIIVGGGGQTKIHQAAAPLIVGKTMDLSQSAACMLVTGEADVKSSWVGIVVAPKATISEDTRVLISTKAALIIAAALFGGFGLVALVMAMGVRRMMRWRPTIGLPSIPAFPSLPHELQLPDMATIQKRIAQHRHSA